MVDLTAPNRDNGLSVNPNIYSPKDKLLGSNESKVVFYVIGGIVGILIIAGLIFGIVYIFGGDNSETELDLDEPNTITTGDETPPVQQFPSGGGDDDSSSSGGGSGSSGGGSGSSGGSTGTTSGNSDGSIADDVVLMGFFADFVKKPGLSPGDIYYNSGLVGIGTTTPTSILTIDGGSFNSPGITFERSGPTAYKDTKALAAISSKEGPAGLRITMSGNDGVNYVDTLFLAKDGKIGVGTTNPLSALHIKKQGTGAELLRLETSNPWVIKENQNGIGGLELHSLNNVGFLDITSANGNSVLDLITSDIASNNVVNLVPAGGNVVIGGGIIVIEPSFVKPGKALVCVDASGKLYRGTATACP